MDKYALFTMLWNAVVQPVDAAGAPMVAALMTVIGPWFRTAALAYIIIRMLIAAWRDDAAGEMALFRMLFLAGIIYTLASQHAAYQAWVVGPIQGFTDRISQAAAGVLNHGGPVTADAYDAIATRSYAIGLAVWKQLPIFSLQFIPFALGIVFYWACSFVAIVFMFSTALASRVGFSFMLDYAPVFIAFYFVPYTRRWFDGWLAVVMTSVFVQIFSAGLASLFIGVIGKIFDFTVAGLGNPGAAAKDGGDVIGSIMLLGETAIIMLVFAGLSGAIVWFAIRIAGGAHDLLGHASMPSAPQNMPALSLSSSSAAPAAPLSMGMPPAPALGGGAPAIGAESQARISASMQRIVGPVQ